MIRKSGFYNLETPNFYFLENDSHKIGESTLFYLSYFV